MKRFIVYIVLLLGIAGCIGECYEDKLTGNYYLLAINSMTDMRITYYPNNESMNYDITESGIYEVGYDEDFILAKAYKTLTDSLGNSLHRYDTDITEYYIVPVDNMQSGLAAQENRFKLLTEKEFEAKRKELGVSDKIAFTISFKKSHE